MSDDPEHVRRENRIKEVFGRAFIISEIKSEPPNTRIKDRNFLTGPTDVVIPIPDGSSLRFVVYAHGSIVPVMPDDTEGLKTIGDLYDEKPEKETALLKEIARRLKEAFGNGVISSKTETAAELPRRPCVKKDARPVT